jgi:serpin B
MSDDDPGIEPELTEKTASLITASNDFGLDLFNYIYAYEEDQENIMVSPLSVSLALAMTYNGALTQTKNDMEKTLRLSGLTSEEINTSYYNLIEALKKMDAKVKLEIANAIYYRDDFEVEQDFIKINKKYYDAEVAPLDFSSDDAVDIINSWVFDHTDGKIETILERISPLHVMFLLNAIYFKGTWQKEFNNKSTEALPFYLENGEQLITETMQRLDTALYTSNELFSAVQLPYGENNFYMTVFLPNPGINLKDITEKLNKETWNSWMENFEITKNIDIKFPRFKYKYEIMLNDVLSEMGMKIAFTSAADFRGINRNGDLLIDYVKHKSFIEVNEEGTEAAAVTIVAIERTSAGGPEKIPFYVNKPFLYTITERSTGAVLFIGTVKNPNLN